MPDFCFILSCHDRAIELLAHLDTLSFCPVPHKIIVVHSGQHNIKFVEYAYSACYKHIEPKGHCLGAVLALTEGLRIAKEQGFRYVCFRNGDDWMLNQPRVEHILKKMREGYKLAGYNWFGSDNYDDFALNELYIDIDAVSALNLDRWDKVFAARVKNDCESHFASMIKSVISPKDIYKLSGRERWDGIGNICWINPDMNNNRFFNLEWQLICDHKDEDRRSHWNRINSLVPYSDMLVHKSMFKSWLDKIPII